MHRPDPHACAEYNALSRRGFMALSAGGAAAFAAAHAWMPRFARAKDHRGGRRDVIVQIYLRGASDGLTMVPPYADANYYAARPTLAVPPPGTGTPNDALDLDGFFGLAPQLAPLLEAYRNQHLLIVHASGSPDPSRSHFDAQRFMEVGRPADPTLGTGWLGRHLATVAPMIVNPFIRAIGIGSGLQKTLHGAPRALPIPDLDEFGITGNDGSVQVRQAALTQMYAAAQDPIRSAAAATMDTINLLNSINFEGYTPAGGAVYPVGNFGTALKQTAALIKAEVGVEAVAIDVGGWDTHDDQGNFDGGTMHTLMTRLASGIAAFYADLVDQNAPDFTLVVLSEFGRRLAENGSNGTDHGHGNAMFVLGRCIAGGRVLAQWPGLEPEQLFQGTDLEVTIDFRDVLAEIIHKRLGNPQIAAVFPGYTPTYRGVVAC